jgi:hypothetical protein
VVGSKVTLKLPDASDTKLVSISDPLGVLENPTITGHEIAANLKDNPGHRRVFATVKTGDLEQIRIFNLHIQPDPPRPPPSPKCPAGAKWKTVDISAALTADITQIYEQKYLSPRPETVSGPHRHRWLLALVFPALGSLPAEDRASTRCRIVRPRRSHPPRHPAGRAIQMGRRS